MALLIIPAVQADQAFNISKIDSPDTVSMDYSKTPLGTTNAFTSFVQYLSDLAEELIEFIASIFDMLGMKDDPHVDDLMTELNQSRDLIKP
ncbi:hypothetical protein [Methanogenium sp. MK-MG]|uniref:hypothetical protein n=1 Tax=Methanogenium sp. MK-MG TaxID=2599926 RepID=UPI0013ECD848|nr:hypothetical protein [Methanogenium sp. MK-MG]